ncbi:RND family transporter [Parvularcula sp. IMCC14364]|uniref:efflux RND transporter permease subunit n=1 Tax=Parvularcula sp. IMCC14364 TaxID=3067902 RepID=UPI0027405352|nr:MMPL family transporter [Parvularcula sp. IMCC14364]
MNSIFAQIGRFWFAAPYMLLALVTAATLFAGLNARNLSYDASADTLVAENDAELAYFLEISQDFGDGAVVFLTYEPLEGDLLSPDSLAQLADLQAQLEAIKGVSAVTSILDVPLFRSPPVELTQLATDFRTLKSPDVDIDLARDELRNSPLYRELLISADGRATAMRIGIEPDTELDELWRERQQLRQVTPRTEEIAQRLRVIEPQYQAARRAFTADQERLMSDIRQVREGISGEAVSYFAGVPMIASDMIRFVKNDILTFGGISLCVVMVALFLFFRRLRWVFLPVATALLAVLLTTGILGFLRQPVTVISSNFVSLLIIFSIAFTVHLIVRYREIGRSEEGLTNNEMLTRAMLDKFAPCLYTALTTMAAFASLMASNIVPVIDLGWIMCVAMATAFFMNYTFFPAVLRLLPEQQVLGSGETAPFLPRVMSLISTRVPLLVILLALGAAAASWYGINRLSTESRFVDYFRASSDISQGLEYINENLGGTTPMEVILTFKPFEEEPVADDDDFFTEEPDAYPERYWYTPDKIALLRQMQEFLEEQPEVGKIISLATLEEVAREFNEGNALNTIQLAAIVGAVPEDLRREFLTPYSSPSDGLMRMSLRMRPVEPRRARDDLIRAIEEYAVSEMGMAPENVRVTGVTVLFNNMLKTLFASQRATIGLVVLATFIMFLILLHSPMLAVAGVVPNLLSAAIVLGFMGVVGITLDMMTMTIAAIIIGIGVDNAIHYLHRYKQERRAGRTRREAIEISHSNIGSAVYFTSITIIAGFSVLALSNFVPTIYFGVLTAMAMGLSLMVNLIVLPSLLMVFGRD